MKETPEQLLAYDAHQLEQTHRQWKATYQYGCHDPFWPDGSNLNLLRNHIIYFKSDIREICQTHDLPLPDIYYEATPDTVPENYMASLDQAERVARLKEMGEKLTTKKTAEEKEQQVFW